MSILIPATQQEPRKLDVYSFEEQIITALIYDPNYVFYNLDTDFRKEPTIVEWLFPKLRYYKLREWVRNQQHLAVMARPSRDPFPTPYPKRGKLLGYFAFISESESDRKVYFVGTNSGFEHEIRYLLQRVEAKVPQVTYHVIYEARNTFEALPEDYSSGW